MYLVLSSLSKRPTIVVGRVLGEFPHVSGKYVVLLIAQGTVNVTLPYSMGLAHFHENQLLQKVKHSSFAFYVPGMARHPFFQKSQSFTK